MSSENEKSAKFTIGQLIKHKIFDYRGVVIDVDPEFAGTDEWYEAVARSKPPKDAPWYHVLVDNAEARTYVAERNIESDESGRPIDHPDLNDYFRILGNDGYLPRRKDN